MEKLIKKVEAWSTERGLNTADPNKQRLKLWEEFGELNAAIARDNREGAIDAIGDMCVVMIIYYQQLGGYHFEKYYSLYDHAITRDIEDLINELGESIIRCNSEIYMTAATYYLDMLANVYYDTNLKDCLQSSYDVIKDRKGKMINGVFVKESDLNG